MTSASTYRAEAKRCRELAASAVLGSAMAERWLVIAVEYEALADALEGGSHVPPQAQRQPMQQQQSKADDKAHDPD